jgi:two-component system, OmpR family, response regulator CpxR
MTSNELRTTNILLVDDDDELCELVADYLSVEGFKVECAHDGASGADRMLSNEFDLAILDVMLPKMNGFEVLRKVRGTSSIPILMLTARGDDMERIVGLEIGADDYLPKPFNPRELVARLRAILRRTAKTDETDSANSKGERLQVDDVEVNTAARSVRRSAEDVELTAIEFDLLVQFLKKAGQVVAREDLSREVLGRRLSPFDRSLDMHVSNLRKKLGNRPDGHERIKTVRSVGYIYTIAT